MKKLLLATAACGLCAGAAAAEDIKLGLLIGFTGPIESLTGHMAAGAEMAQTDTPPRVVITEFVQLAQAFFPEGKESAFVNAVLDHMAREARPGDFA